MNSCALICYNGITLSVRWRGTAVHVIKRLRREEKGNTKMKQLVAMSVLCMTLLFSCKAPEVKKPLEGKWRAVVSQGNETEKYLPDEIEFFPDATVVMSDFPGKRLPYKTDLTAEEKKLIKKNYPELQGKDVVLILLDPSQKDWKAAVAYQFMVKGDELTLRPVISDKPILFRKVSSGARQ
jgi:hypothetical protein